MRLPLRGLVFCGLKAFSSLLAKAMQGVEDDGVRLTRRAYLIDLDGFAFQLCNP